MSHQFEEVKAFMRRFGQETQETPGVPSDEVIRNRCRWLLEETLEFLEACFGEEAHGNIEAAASELAGLIRWAPVRVDLEQYADANADIRYVAYGNDVAAGIDGREMDAEVARSNRTKSPPDAPGGKVAKGPNYEPPAIAAILREQGWGQ